jgi:hypothetical protein
VECVRESHRSLLSSLSSKWANLECGKAVVDSRGFLACGSEWAAVMLHLHSYPLHPPFLLQVVIFRVSRSLSHQMACGATLCASSLRAAAGPPLALLCGALPNFRTGAHLIGFPDHYACGGGLRGCWGHVERLARGPPRASPLAFLMRVFSFWSRRPPYCVFRSLRAAKFLSGSPNPRAPGAQY